METTAQNSEGNTRTTLNYGIADWEIFCQNSVIQNRENNWYQGLSANMLPNWLWRCSQTNAIYETFNNKYQQAENGQSRRLIRGSKSAKFSSMSWPFFMKNSQRFTQRKPSVLWKRFRSSDIAVGTNASNSFRTSASSSVKRNTVRKWRQIFPFGTIKNF